MVNCRNTQEEDIARNPIPALSSFDILVYAYLKEAITNTRESREVSHLNSKKNLVWFVKYIDLIMSSDYLKDQTNNSNRILTLEKDSSKLNKIVNQDLRQANELKFNHD